MEAYFLDWANLLLRWAHLIVGIAWIGASFYFVMLDNSLKPPKKSQDAEKGVHGDSGPFTAVASITARNISPAPKASR